MPIFKSEFEIPENTEVICGLPILRLHQTHYLSSKFTSFVRSDSRPAKPDFVFAMNGVEKPDIVDEALRLFRANVLFKSFPVQSPLERILAYLTMFLNHMLLSLRRGLERKQITSRRGAKDFLTEINDSLVAVPGESAFPLSEVFLTYRDGKEQTEKNTLRNYFRLLRLEAGNRIIDVLFADEPKMKHWLQFGASKFMGIATIDGLK